MLLYTLPQEAKLNLVVTQAGNSSSTPFPHAGVDHQMECPARLGLCSMDTSECVSRGAHWHISPTMSAFQHPTQKRVTPLHPSLSACCYLTASQKSPRLLPPLPPQPSDTLPQPGWCHRDKNTGIWEWFCRQGCSQNSPCAAAGISGAGSTALQGSAWGTPSVAQ